MNLNYWHAQFESSTPTRANMVNSVQMQHVTNEEEVLSDTFACLGPPLPLGEKRRGLCYTILPTWRCYQQRFGNIERVLLESEFGIVRVPNHPQWLGFRDVVKVHGKALSRDTRVTRLDSLNDLTRPSLRNHRPKRGSSTHTDIAHRRS